MVVAPVEGSAGAGPASHGCPLASRRVPWMLRCRSRRRPGRPCIDSQLRALIRRMAAENGLWGAPRIHGELLKLGFAVSERTVSRYLRDRLTAPSQTWRTCLANHLGDVALISMVTSSYAPSNDDDVHACGLPRRRAWSLRDGAHASNQCTVVDWPPSRACRATGETVLVPPSNRWSRSVV